MSSVRPYLAYDAVADDYDRTRAIPDDLLRAVSQICDMEARLDRGGLFLDAGVGTGRFAAPLSQLRPGQVVGVDVSYPMMERAQRKAGEAVHLVHGDLQRLPFHAGVFKGVLIVHILHLIGGWKQVLTEARRVLKPTQGVLLLGSEVAGRSILVDHYFERARSRGVLAANPGTSSISTALEHLRRPTRRPGASAARITTLSIPYLAWQRVTTIQETLGALERQTYSQTWGIGADDHARIMDETTTYALRSFGALHAEERLEARFVLHTVRWPNG